MWYESLDGSSIHRKALTSPGQYHTEAYEQISLPPAGSEPRNSVFEWFKNVCALDQAATVGSTFAPHLAKNDSLVPFEHHVWMGVTSLSLSHNKWFISANLTEEHELSCAPLSRQSDYSWWHDITSFQIFLTLAAALRFTYMQLFIGENDLVIYALPSVGQFGK
jgi:hypothetical protein